MKLFIWINIWVVYIKKNNNETKYVYITYWSTYINGIENVVMVEIPVPSAYLWSNIARSTAKATVAMFAAASYAGMFQRRTSQIIKPI